jgi:hypothetical protein
MIKSSKGMKKRWFGLSLCFALQFAIQAAFGQSRMITMDLKDVPLITAIEAIKKQTDYRFSYDIALEKLLNERKITIKVRQEAVEKVLIALFRLTGIEYRIVSNNILLSKGKVPSASTGSILLQTVKGKVTDQESKVPLTGVSVILDNGISTAGTVTGADGTFSLRSPLGMQSLKFTHTGYEQYTAVDISVISGRENFLNIEMRETIVTLNEVVVAAANSGDRPLNSMASVSARQLTTEDAGRYAAGFYDPARMASVFAGVMTNDDGRNDIVIRGNSPLGLLWKLEGIEIPNPNHFADGQGSSGGIFNIISSDVLANSDFFTGAFPAEYGNATAGILDLNLRKGNADKREYGIQVGMIGSQVSFEGPLGKNRNVSYLFNYRYGNLQFLNNLGLLGLNRDRLPPVFQDLNFNIALQTRKAGSFSLFGIGGISSTGTRSDTLYMNSVPVEKEEQTENHKMGVLGLKHMLTLPNNKTFLKTIVAASYQYDRLKTGGKTTEAYSYPSVRLATTLGHKFNARHSIRTGLIYSQLFFDAYGTRENDTTNNQVAVNNKGTTGLASAFVEWKYRLTDKFAINSGVHGTVFLLNHNYSIEPRLGLSWQVGSKSSVTYGFGLHSRAEPLSVYFLQTTSPDGTVTTPNKDLELTKAMHHVLGYDLLFLPGLRLKIEAYYQHLYHVPIIDNPNSTYSRINSLYGVPDSALASKGKGYNKGIELTLEKFYSNNYYFLLTGSLFDSKYKAGDGKTYNTYFNTGYQANFLAGKDFKVGNTRQNIFSLNFKALTRGGFRYTPIAAEPYAKQMPYYLRFDLGLKYRKNNPRYSWILSLDVQNIANRKNVLEYESGITPNNEWVLRPKEGLGIVPVLNLKIEL